VLILKTAGLTRGPDHREQNSCEELLLLLLLLVLVLLVLLFGDRNSIITIAVHNKHRAKNIQIVRIV